MPPTVCPARDVIEPMILELDFDLSEFKVGVKPGKEGAKGRVEIWTSTTFRDNGGLLRNIADAVAAEVGLIVSGRKGHRHCIAFIHSLPPGKYDLQVWELAAILFALRATRLRFEAIIAADVAAAITRVDPAEYPLYKLP